MDRKSWATVVNDTKLKDIVTKEDACKGRIVLTISCLSVVNEIQLSQTSHQKTTGWAFSLRITCQHGDIVCFVSKNSSNVSTKAIHFLVHSGMAFYYLIFRVPLRDLLKSWTCERYAISDRNLLSRFPYRNNGHNLPPLLARRCSSCQGRLKNVEIGYHLILSSSASISYPIPSRLYPH